MNNQPGMHTRGIWRYQRYMQDDAQLAEMKAAGIEPILTLTNKGQAIIMGGPDGETRRVALVDSQVKRNRGEAYKTQCAERDANAHLIASAPELLAALEKLEQAVDVFSADQGRATDKRCGLVQPVTVAECDELNAAIKNARAAIAKAKGQTP